MKTISIGIFCFATFIQCGSDPAATDAPADSTLPHAIITIDSLPHPSSKYYRDSIDPAERAKLTNILSDPLSDTAMLITPVSTYDKSEFILFSKYSGGFDGMMNFILVADESVDSVFYNQESKRVTIYANSISRTGADFFKLENNLLGYFFYNRFHDIYQALFRYPAIAEVCVTVDGNNETYFPSNGEQPPVPPDGVMKTQWYMRNINYWEVFDEENTKLFRQDREYPFVLANSTVVDESIRLYRNNHPKK